MNKIASMQTQQTGKLANHSKQEKRNYYLYRYYSRATLRTGQLDSLDSCTAIHTNLILCAYQKLSTYISSAISI